MDAVTPVGALNSVFSRGEVFRKLSETEPGKIHAQTTAGQPNTEEPTQPTEKSDAAPSETKLFTGVSLPLHGLYELVMIDDNGDGRVDAGDAVSEVLMMAQRYEGQNKPETPTQTVDQLA